MFRFSRFSLVCALIALSCFARSTVNQPAAPQAAVPSGQAASPSPKTASGASAPNVAPPTASSSGATTDMNPLGTARALYRRGDFKGAIGKYEEYMSQHPGSPDAYAGLVRVYLKQKNVEQAAQLVERGLARSDSRRVHVARGEVWLRQGRIADAEKEWIDVVNSGFPEARAYLGIARVRNAMAMYKSAKKMFDKAHELDPADPDIQEYWANTLSHPERIKFLEDSLAGENNWDATEREEAKSYLEYLKGRSKQNGSSCRLVSKVNATETPFVRSSSFHIGLSVVLNGHKSLLVLDTGAGGIIVKRSIAEHAGISKITAAKVGGIGDEGTKNGFFGIADSIKIGELEFQNCLVKVMESRSVVGEDGLIGTDVFQDFLVDIDFPDGKLKLSQLPMRPGETQQQLSLNPGEDDTDGSGVTEPSNSSSDESKEASKKGAAPTTAWPGPQDRYISPEMQSYTPVFRFGHDLLVPTIIGDAPSKLFLLDTGSNFNLISPAAAREVTKVHGDYDTTVKGLSGRVDKVYTAKKAVLQFGHLRQENQEMTALDTKAISDDVGTEVSGFLGFAMLQFLDIKIDYRDALVDFSYNPSHLKK